MSFVVGIDVGGTNTDVVIIQGSEVIGWSKSPTTENILDGVVDATKSALHNASLTNENVINNIKRVHIGTTHFINAVIKRRGLSKVASIRLCGDASHSLPPFTDFPKDLAEIVNGGYHMLQGGFEFNGKVISEIDTDEITKVINGIASRGINHVAISGIFSPTNPSHENHVGDMLQKLYPNVTYTLSHQLGHLGLIERENATILNESLKALCKKTINGFKRALIKLGLHCPVFFTQNDGTLISEAQTLKYPVFTFSSGATNSMRGAAHLSSLKDAVIVDIGGTSTDVGVLKNGFPREASSRIKIGGVNTHFHMPDVKSIGLGGGSLVTINEDQSVLVGPKSVEYNITKDALVFGGDVLVSTDIAVACGIANVGDKEKVACLDEELKKKALNVIRKMVEEAVDSVKLNAELCPVVLVGGGSLVIDCNQKFVGASSITKPSNYQVANAVGAALSKVSGSIDKLVTITDTSSRDKVLEDAKKEAISVAVINGAIEESCIIVEVSEVKMSYVAVPAFRIQVKAVGELEYIDQSDKILHQTLPVETETLPMTGEINNLKKKEKTDGNISNVARKETKKPVFHDPFVTDNGEWILSLWDADCIAIGAGILGCGGGGSPYLGRLRLKTCIEKGLQVKVIHPSSLQENQTAYGVAFMGAPEILIERVANGREMSDAVRLLHKLIETHVDDVCVERIANSHGWEMVKFDDENCIGFKVPPTESLVSSPAAIFPCEIGGLNAIEPLVLGGELGIPVLDCDGMGRAFPKLQHFAPFILGSSCFPAVIADHKGNHVCCVKCDSASALERVFRKQSIQMGCAAGVSFGALSKDEISSKTCLYTISRAWYLGNAVLLSRNQHKSPINAIIEETNGKVLAQGKICDVYRETKEGFTWGKVKIEGSCSWENMAVEFQNEFIIAKSLDSNETLATVPDLITVVDTDSGEPITTDELKYGLRVTILVLPSMPLMCTPKALEFVSPKAFGYPDIEYKPACEFVPVKPIPSVILV